MNENEEAPRPLSDDDIVTTRVYGRRSPLAELSVEVLAGSESVLEPRDDEDDG